MGMKLFHLADLHFGKCFHGYSMIEMGDQPFWMEELLKKTDEMKPDGVLIAGDVYDRAVPSKEAVRLFDEFLTEFAKREIPVFLIAGNHDSGSRLAFGDKLLCKQGVYIAGEIKREVAHVTMQDGFGPVHVWLMPYLFPAAVNVVLDRDDLKDYDSAIRALLEIQNINSKERNIILSHQFVIAGGEKPTMGGSETTVGGIGQIESSAYDAFDYVALGHIHNAQRMGREQVRYAGSPLCYHFSEANQKKGLTVVELEEKGNVRISIEEIPVLHPMCELTGTLDEILEADVKKNRYVKVILRQECFPPQTVELLREHFAKKECILMEVARDLSSKNRKNTVEELQNIQNLSLEELFLDFYSYQYEGDLPEENLGDLITFVAEQSRNGYEDESESERKQATEKLIAYAGREV